MEGSDFVRISNREIYDAIVSLRNSVNRMESRVDTVLGENVELRKQVRALELRVYASLAGLIAAAPMLARAGGLL